MGEIAGLPATRVLVVRRAELATLWAALADARRGFPRFVLVEGEPGMGRTALLDQFATEADDAFVLRGSGEEFETPLRYGVLSQLCRSVDVASASALPAVCAGPDGRSAEPFTVGAALLEMVDDLQDRAPVVVVIDDAHLADAPSQLALLFALRRLQDQRVLTVLSAPIDRAALVVRGLRKLIEGEAGTTLCLTGLADADIRQLGTMIGQHRLSRALVERLREHTGGNPAHIRELLEDPGVEALERLSHAPLPAPRSVRLLVQGRLAACTAPARRLLAAIAVVGKECEFGMARRLAAVDEPLLALEGAVAVGLVEYCERHVRFLSPLVRSAVYHALGITERAELHAGAARFTPDRASMLRHLAAAATEENSELASVLSTFAHSEAHRGALSGAANLFMDAARLAPAGPARETHIHDALECLLSAGDVAAATPLASELESSHDPARAHYLLGRLARLHGRPFDAERLLNSAEGLHSQGMHTDLAAKLAAELAGLSIALLRPAEALGWARAALRSSGGADTSARTLPYLALGLGLTGCGVDTPELVFAIRQAEGKESAASSDVLLAQAIVHQFSGAARRARDDAARLLTSCGTPGQPIVRVFGLAVLAFAEYRTGAWEDSVSHAELGLSAAGEAGLDLASSTLHAAAVWPLVGMGRWDAAESHASSSQAAVHGPWDQAMASTARAVLAAGQGRPADVLDAVAVVRSAGASGAVDEPDGFWPWPSLYVDASISLGHLDDAAGALERFEALVVARRSALGAATAARLRGALQSARGRQDDADADAAFRHAIALASKLPSPFELALARLAYGAFLRRSGKRTAAVVELRGAQDLFTRLGARPWSDECGREIAASGLAPRKRRRSQETALTPQESSVARLVAQGKSNRDVASELVVSVNTIEYHLKNIFAKLGIRSRSQLVLRLAAQPPGEQPPGPAGSLRRSSGV